MGEVNSEGDRFCIDEAIVVVDAFAPPKSIAPLAPKAIKEAKRSGNPVKGRELPLLLEENLSSCLDDTLELAILRTSFPVCLEFTLIPYETFHSHLRCQ